MSIVRSQAHNNVGPSVNTVNLSKIAYLYMVASVFQVGWLYLVFSNQVEAKQLANIPFIGWALVVIWALMLWCIPHLFYIGAKMWMMSRNRQIRIQQTAEDKQKQKFIAMILLIGIIMDICLAPLLFQVADKGLVLFLTGMMGGRVLKGNVEAILQYHSM